MAFTGPAEAAEEYDAAGTTGGAVVLTAVGVSLLIAGCSALLLAACSGTSWVSAFTGPAEAAYEHGTGGLHRRLAVDSLAGS